MIYQPHKRQHAGFKMGLWLLGCLLVSQLHSCSAQLAGKRKDDIQRVKGLHTRQWPLSGDGAWASMRRITPHAVVCRNLPAPCRATLLRAGCTHTPAVVPGPAAGRPVMSSHNRRLLGRTPPTDTPAPAPAAAGNTTGSSSNATEVRARAARAAPPLAQLPPASRLSMAVDGSAALK